MLREGDDMSNVIKTAMIVTIVLCVVIGAVYFTMNSKSIDPNGQMKLVTDKNSVISPSGAYLLKMKTDEVNRIKGFRISIYSYPDNDEIFISEDFYRLRDVSYLLWGERDIIWLYNGDLGTFFWELDDGLWEKKAYVDNQESVEIPQLLKELRPSIFK